jgi:predicted nucleic acid-binding protein
MSRSSTKKFSPKNTVPSSLPFFLKALQELPNVRPVEVHYQWNLLAVEDDNKFVDAAVAGGAAYIVSEDRHFRRLAEVDFPKVQLMRLEDFRQWYESLA